MIKKIVIAGGGSSGWMTASYLSVHLPGVEIELIESSEIPIIGVGESTIPPMMSFMKSLGLEEKEWMPQCNATFKSAIGFKNFYNTTDPTFWYSFEPMKNIGQRPMARHWFNKHLTSPTYKDRFSFYDYCFITPEVCRQGKTLAAMTSAGRAYQLDAGLMGEMLRKLAQKNGVKRVIDTISNVNLNEDGGIASLSRENGEDLIADLFIDCTGFRSVLLQQALGEPYEDYNDYLFNDKAVALRFPFEDKEKELTSYTMSTAVSSGWIWEIPLYSRKGSGYVYCSRYKSPDDAETELRQFLGEERVKDVEARHLNFRVGRTRRMWVKNCIGIGLSSGFVEPLESTALFAVQHQVETLAQTLVGRNDYNVADVSIYNRVQDDLYTGIRDFLVAHYALTSREDTPYWKDVKYATKIPDSLTSLLRYARMTLPDLPVIQQIYRANFGDFSFTDGWMSVLIGMNHMPLKFGQFQGAGPFEAEVVKSLNQAQRAYQQQKDFIRTKFPTVPSHYQYLKDKIYSGKA